MQQNISFISYAKEVMFSPVSVCQQTGLCKYFPSMKPCMSIDWVT